MVEDYKMDFDLMLLKPAIKGEVAATGGDTARNEVLALIEMQLALFAYPKANGQRLYEIEGDTVTFTLRYGGRALTLLPDETKVSVPKDALVGALEHYKAEVTKDAFDAQLEKNSAASAFRKASAKVLRDDKKGARPANFYVVAPAIRNPDATRQGFFACGYPHILWPR